MLNDCQEIPLLEGTTGADLLRKLVEVGEMYNLCAKEKKALNEAVRQLPE